MRKDLVISTLFFLLIAESFAQPGIINPAGKTPFITTGKCAYKPGDTVVFTAAKLFERGTRIRYKHLNNKVADVPLTTARWVWKVPAKDHTGYLAEVYIIKNGLEKIITTIGIDVSSDWKKFPRYGFVSKYEPMSTAAVEKVIDDLNRFHINGLQFYDWHYKHHRPLAGSTQHPDSIWKDIGGRSIYASTIRSYIKAGHDKKMKAMFYNLVYGTFKDAEQDGVSPEWYLYTDSSHVNREKFELPKPPFASDLYFTDPSNTKWQQYITKENRKVYDVYDFDGYHMDQVGNRDKNFYKYDGSPVDLSKTFESFINNIKKYEPAKSVVMNAVNQYGQEGIAKTPVDFLYTEVWPPHDGYDGLSDIILQNNALSTPLKNTALTAYIHFVEGGKKKGFFNTPSVLLADAVIFAFGGSHLELGEHMLGAPYFPEDNLQMTNVLKDAILPYYDFLVAYENLLRDGGKFNSPLLRASPGKIRLSEWPAKKGEVSYIGKEFEKRQVIHLINFTDATTLEWRDIDHLQKEPTEIKDIRLSLNTNKGISAIWHASPDVNKGSAQKISFVQKNGEVSFMVPSLKYWDMIVLEYR